MSDEVFRLLVDEHYASLYRFAYSLARNLSDACDLTQQTFYIWAQRGTGLRDASKAKSWLFTTLYREFLRTRKRDNRHAPIEEADMESLVATEDATQLVSKLDAGALMETLSEIDEVYRVPLTLFYLESLSYREIADLLQVPVGTVMSRLSRGKQQLRKALERRGENGNVVPFDADDERRRQS